MPDFSLLFCLTHFTFINFSYDWTTNLFFSLKFFFHSDRHTRTKTNESLSSIDEGWTLHQPQIKSLSYSKTLFVMTNLHPLVRTMVFTPDFSLLFCLTHFTFVNFSQLFLYHWTTNLFSYLLLS